jgi:hypothetical protein
MRPLLLEAKPSASPATPTGWAPAFNRKLALRRAPRRSARHCWTWASPEERIVRVEAECCMEDPPPVNPAGAPDRRGHLIVRPAPMSERDWEPGYKAVLIREETKQRLQQLRKALPERDLNQERRLATAAIEYCLTDAVARAGFLALVKDIVRLDLETPDADSHETTMRRRDHSSFPQESLS